LSKRALIFDCDGVLVNSEEIVVRIQQRHLKQIGLHYSQAELVTHFLGLTQQDSRALFVQHAAQRQVAPPGPDFFEQVRKAVLAVYADELVALHGVADLINAWPDALAVASSSKRSGLLHKLNITQLQNSFGAHIYSGDDVEHGKPNPEIFLLAAAKLGVAPQNCYVIEDSVYGVRAAHAAGMTTLGYIGGKHCLSDQGHLLLDNGAAAVFASHHEIMAHLNLV